MSRKLYELTDEELAQVFGGSALTPARLRLTERPIRERAANIHLDFSQ